MKKTAFIFNIIATFALLMPYPSFAWEGRVVKVSDGDTVHVEPIEGGNRIKIRLYGIDCPERKQPHGSIATGYVTRVALFKCVEIIEHDIDRYGRSVSELILPDGTNLNRELVVRGHAWVYERYCKEDFCREWQELERKARNSKKGLWNSENPTAPWDWRRGKSKNKGKE